MKQISLYLDEYTLKQIDKMKILIEYSEHVKSSRSDVIRRALNNLLKNLYTT